MISLVSLVHALTCIFVVIFILLQDPKGGVLGTLGGGSGAKNFFGAEGASSFLVKATKWLAITFALCSFYLSYMSSQDGSSLMTPTSQEAPLNPSTPEKDTTSPSKDSGSKDSKPQKGN